MATKVREAIGYAGASAAFVFGIAVTALAPRATRQADGKTVRSPAPAGPAGGGGGQV